MGNVKAKVDGITFDSTKEAQFYVYLKSRKRMGQIVDIELQPRFELQPKFKKGKVSHRAINYVADFRITHPDGRQEIIDVKGMKTEVFKMKHKMFEYRYPELTLLLI